MKTNKGNSEVKTPYDKGVDVHEFVRPGKSYRIYFGKGNVNNKLIHVRAIVDNTHAVYRSWLRHKGYWGYDVECLYYLGLLLKDGHLLMA